MVMCLGMATGIAAQPLIGMGKEEVRVFMDKERKEFRIDKTVVKQQFNYLKYVNNIQSKTLIIFFSEDDICTRTKLACDYNELDKMTEELERNYEKTGDDTWEYDYNGKTFMIRLEKEEWYFVLKETQKEM